MMLLLIPGALVVVGLVILVTALRPPAGTRAPIGPRSPADVQAIQDAPPFDRHAEQARALTDVLSIGEWAECEHAFAADALAYRGGLGMPGEQRTNWTREDYKS